MYIWGWTKPQNSLVGIVVVFSDFGNGLFITELDLKYEPN